MHAVFYHPASYPPDADVPGAGADEPTMFIDASAAPARILADLEHRGVRRMTLPSALLWRLCREPAAFMTDLSSVRAVVHRGGTPDPADVALAEEVFGPVLVHVPDPAAEPAGAPDRNLRQLAAAAAVAGEAATGPVTAEQVAGYIAALEPAALDSMLAALQAHRVLDDPTRSWTSDQVLAALEHPPHHNAVRRWLRVLVEHGRLARSADGYRGADPVPRAVVEERWRRARRAWAGHLGDATFIDYIADNAARLDDLLRGRQHPASLLFPRGDTRIADAVYRDTATARYLNAAVAATVGRRAAERPLRILEVGAGTGATTDAIVAELGPDADVDYLFTDVSQFFLSAARSRFGALGWMRYGLLDVDRPEIGECYDVIVAAGVLNNSHDIGACVSSLAAALSPGGLLLITEPVRESLEILVSQVFMMTPPTDVRATDGTTFASQQRWSAVLAAAGLDTVVLPDEGHVLAPLGQRLLVGARR